MTRAGLRRAPLCGRPNTTLERLGECFFPALCLSCGRGISAAERVEGLLARLGSGYRGARASSCRDSWYRDALCGSCLAKLPLRKEGERLLPLLSWRLKPLPEAEDRRLAGRLCCLVALHYRACVPRLLRELKFSRRRCNARLLAAVLADALRWELSGSPWLEPGEVTLTSVPPSARRLRRRGFDQVAELAFWLSDMLALPYRPLLTRTRDGPRQSEAPFAERFANTADSFAALEGLWGRRILLLDDVLSSGATLFHAAKALHAAGAEAILALAAAGGRRSEVQRAGRAALDAGGRGA